MQSLTLKDCLNIYRGDLDRVALAITQKHEVLIKKQRTIDEENRIYTITKRTRRFFQLISFAKMPKFYRKLANTQTSVGGTCIFPRPMDMD